MKSYNSSLRGYLGLLVYLLFSSCGEELNHVGNIGKNTITPLVNLPLVNSEFTLNQFLSEGNTKSILKEVDGTMQLTYESDVAFEKGKDVYKLPSVRSRPFEYSLNPIPPGIEQRIEGLQQNFTFDIRTPQNERLDSLTGNTCRLTFRVESTLPFNANLVMTIPSLKMADGSNFIAEHTIMPETSEAYNYSLKDFTIDLTGNGNQVNKLVVLMSTSFTTTGEGVNNPRIELVVDVENLDFKTLFGNLGSRIFTEDQNTIDIDVLKNIRHKNSDSYLEMENISVLFTAENSYGLPVSFNLNELAIVKEDGSTQSLSGDVLSPTRNPYRLNYPSIDQVGQISETQVTIDRSNSNIIDLFSALPRQITHAFQIKFESQDQLNFVTSASDFQVKFQFDTRLVGKARTILLTQEIDFDNAFLDIVELNSLYIKTINEFPFSLDFQGYFLDKDGARLDSLFEDGTNLLKAAPINTEGVPIGVSESIKENDVSKERFQRIKTTSKMLLEAVLTTSNNGTVPVKISGDTKLKVTVGAKSRLKYSF